MVITRSNPNDSESELETTLGDSNVNLEGLNTAKEAADAVEQQMQTEENVPTDEGLNWFSDTSNPENLGLIYTADGEMLQSFSAAMDYLLNKAGEANVDIDPVTPLEVSFTMPGIGGIRMFDLFAVDYLPEIYRNYTLFQVNGVSHTLSPSGWDTAITGIARVDMDSLISAAKNSNKFKDDAPDIVKDTTKQNNVSFLQFKQNSKKDDKPKEAKAEG